MAEDWEITGADIKRELQTLKDNVEEHPDLQPLLDNPPPDDYDPQTHIPPENADDSSADESG